ncbi:uncharacterized protein A1O9_08122 [Exophiala aquamarina CBS 119918]|uniref:Zn(2)-C6 fungal-type domain-containing protein n=1 Tax=Exophiala aquamarina CBS 119918 TaxID=1182545 RepID=A0A072P6N3_9EURO|nr:uncharacterized protein A1O9_08122 [Exophiala aquamarina CBS 119918]KEF55372.1 hypothetical protein A1O9_08122 [Exophiala aquamarina CBS 119918]
MPRKREPRACDICRSRKVRCNSSEIGLPCSNCSRVSAVCSLNAAWGKTPLEKPARNHVPSANIHTFRVGESKSYVPSSENTFKVAATFSSQASSDALHRNATDKSPQGLIDPLLPPLSVELPNYIKPLPRTIDQDILRLLYQKGALKVPPKEVSDELVRGFICYVYPFLPVLDLGTFLDALGGTNGQTISLLLFQAVMMVGATFAEFSQLKRAGFQSHKDAQRIFFERVKLLYDMDVESNSITMIQVLLLMTHWQGQLNDPKGRLYWLGIALSFATGMGLDSADRFPHQSDQGRFCGRLWACCMTRSHILSLTERRQIPLHYFAREVQVLRLEDLDCLALTRGLEMYYLPGRDVEAKAMCHFYIQKIKLCVILRHIFELQYERRGLKCVDSSDTLMVLMPKTRTPSVYMVAHDQELRDWYGETSSMDTAFGQDHRRNGRVLGVHSAALEMLYLTALTAVHRPNGLYDQSPDSATRALQDFSCLTLRSSARRITEIARLLEGSNVVQYLPPLAIGAFIAASIQHLKDALSSDSELQGTGSLYLSQTLRVFGLLRMKYNSVDSAICFIERVKSSKDLSHSFEWETRFHPMNLWDEIITTSYSTGEQKPRSPAETPSLSQLNMQGNNLSLTEQIHPATPQSFHDSNEISNAPARPVLNLEGYSEILLATMDWSQVDPAMTTGI